MCRVMIIADSVKFLSSEAANSKAASTASSSMSAAYSNSALFLSEFARMTTLFQNISAAYLSVCTFCSSHCRSWGSYQEDNVRYLSRIIDNLSILPPVSICFFYIASDKLKCSVVCCL